MLIPYGAQAQYDYFPWEVLNEGRQQPRDLARARVALARQRRSVSRARRLQRAPSIFSNGSIINSKFRLTDLPPADQFKPDRPCLPPL